MNHVDAQEIVDDLEAAVEPFEAFTVHSHLDQSQGASVAYEGAV